MSTEHSEQNEPQCTDALPMSGTVKHFAAKGYSESANSLHLKHDVNNEEHVIDITRL